VALKTLRDELKMTKPFKSVEEEALLSIARTAALIEHAGAEAFKPFNLTITQYNVLRILRGAGIDGLCRNEVGERLVTKVPDVTRLLDRMEAAGLIVRFTGGRSATSARSGFGSSSASWRKYGALRREFSSRYKCLNT
jgi:DNA-binding MarR family transcriptional regulator